MTKSDDLPLRTEQEIVLGRQMVRKLCQELTFSLVDQTKMVTAASELAATPWSMAVAALCIGNVSSTETKKVCGSLSPTKAQGLQTWNWR